MSYEAVGRHGHHRGGFQSGTWPGYPYPPIYQYPQSEIIIITEDEYKKQAKKSGLLGFELPTSPMMLSLLAVGGFLLYRKVFGTGRVSVRKK
jgi:hypothetical protein